MEFVDSQRWQSPSYSSSFNSEMHNVHVRKCIYPSMSGNGFTTRWQSGRWSIVIHAANQCSDWRRISRIESRRNVQWLDSSRIASHRVASRRVAGHRACDESVLFTLDAAYRRTNDVAHSSQTHLWTKLKMKRVGPAHVKPRFNILGWDAIKYLVTN